MLRIIQDFRKANLSIFPNQSLRKDKNMWFLMSGLTQGYVMPEKILSCMMRLLLKRCLLMPL